MRHFIQIAHLVHFTREFPKRAKQSHDPPRKTVNPCLKLGVFRNTALQVVDRKGMPGKGYVFEFAKLRALFSQLNSRTGPIGNIGICLQSVGVGSSGQFAFGDLAHD